MFKLVSTGYAVGVGVISLPLTAVFALGTLVIMDGPKQFELLLAPLMVALIVVLQALAIGIIVMFGLAVFQRFRRIEMRRAEDQQGA